MEVQPKQIGFFCRGFSDADRDLSSGSLAQKENYELELNGTVQLDWTAEEMARPPMWSRCSRKRMSSDCSLRKTPVPSLAGGKAPEA